MGYLSIVAIITLFIPLLAIFLYHESFKEVIHKAAGFTSRSVCSAVFLSRRKFDDFVVGNELSILPPGLFASSIDWQEKYVEAYLFSKQLSLLLQIPVSTAVYLGPNLGCQLQFEGFKESHKMSRQAESISTVSSPHPKKISDCVQRVLSDDFTPEGLAKNQTRAAIIIHKGNVIGEGYQTRMGITADTPLLGWSMTKSAHAAILGAAVTAGILSLDDPLQLGDMSVSRKEKLRNLNRGEALTFRHLLHMHDVLEIEENYGIFADVVHMLCGSPDTAAYAASATTKPINPSGPHQHGSPFNWYYSSGVSNLLAKELRAKFSSDAEYRQFPQTHLFSRIGATSFAIEMDTTGTFIASSFGYATARDWARLGELFLNKGNWKGQQILSEEFVELVQQPHPRSGGHYGGQFWLNPARVSVAEYNMLPHNHRDKQRRVWTTQVLPADAYYMNGYLGQTTMIIPSLDTVVVRLGYTREQMPDEVPVWNPQKFYGGILECVRQL